MYQVFLGTVLLPVAPSKIETIIGSRTQTIDLINGQEVSILKSASLTQIQFEFMIPSKNYPFTTLSGGLFSGGVTGAATTTTLLSALESLKNAKKPFQFIVARIGSGLKITNAYNTNIKVTLEDYTITEDAENGTDIIVSIRLLQYRPYSTKILKEDGTVQKTRV